MKILNIAAGQKIPDIYNKATDALIQLDLRYYNNDSPKLVEIYCEKDEKGIWYVNEDAMQFLEKTILKFDKVICHRFLEHVCMDQILFFIYQMAEVLNPDGQVDIIVPDYAKLAELILTEKVGAKGWTKHDILVTTEIVNMPDSPHASIWTEDRLKYNFELEDRFKTVSCERDYTYDGRDIYLHYIATRR